MSTTYYLLDEGTQRYIDIDSILKPDTDAVPLALTEIDLVNALMNKDEERRIFAERAATLCIRHFKLPVKVVSEYDWRYDNVTMFWTQIGSL